MDPITVTLFDDAPVYGGAERYLELLATGFDRREVAARVVLAREAGARFSRGPPREEGCAGRAPPARPDAELR